MKLERLSQNKIKIFFTFDDLYDRGVTKEDIKGNSLKVHKLFQDMVEEACEELNFTMSGSVAIEIFSLQAQGLVIIVTKEDEWLEEEEDYLDLAVKMDESRNLLFFFEDIEEVIQLSHCLKRIGILGGMLSVFEGRYYLLLSGVSSNNSETVISLASEYGTASTLTVSKIEEYGSCIIEKGAVMMLTCYFKELGSGGQEKTV